MEKLMDKKLRIEKGKLIDEIKLKELPILTEELKQLTKEFIVDYLIDKLTQKVEAYNSKSMFTSLPRPISPKEIRILSLYDSGDYNRNVIKDMRNSGRYRLNPIQMYILKHKQIYEESDKIVSDSITFIPCSIIQRSISKGILAPVKTCDNLITIFFSIAVGFCICWKFI